MKLRIFTIASCFILILMACKTKKNTVTTKTDTTVVTTNTTSTTTTNNNTALVSANPLEPGDKEVAAIKPKFADITVATLAEGYRVYSGPCQKCHNEAKMQLYKRSDNSWQHEIDVMSIKARITADEKDALWKYVMAMRASHPNETK